MAETLTIFLEMRPRQDVGSWYVSRPRRRDRDHNPARSSKLLDNGRLAAQRYHRRAARPSHATFYYEWWIIERYWHWSDATITNLTYETANFYHPLVYINLYVCNTINFESLHVQSSSVVYGYILRGYDRRSSLYMKVIGSRSRSHQQKVRNFLFPQCKTSIGHNFGYIEDRAVKFAYSMVFSAMAHRMV